MITSRCSGGSPRGRVTEKALLQVPRFNKALARTPNRIVLGWSEGGREILSPDQEWADCLGLGIDTAVVNGKRRSTLQFVGYEAKTNKNGYSRFRELAQWRLLTAGIGPHGVPADDAIEGKASEDRTVYLHSYFDRILQRSAVDLLTPLCEPLFPNGVHGYRPGRSHRSALLHGRRLIRRGYWYAAALDIRQFFPSVRLDQVVAVLATDLPELSRNLVRVLLWFLTVKVRRRPWHPDRRAGGPLAIPPPGGLLTGSVIAPLISNLVGAHCLDRPFQQEFGDRVVLLRYVDDLLLLGTKQSVVERAIAFVQRLLGDAGFAVHPEKGTRNPTTGAHEAIDVRRERLAHLGYEIHGGSVRLADDTLRAAIDALVQADPGTWDFATKARSLIDRLTFDPPSRMGFVERELGRRSRLHQYSFELIGRNVNRDFTPDAEPDGEDYAAVGAAGEEEMNREVAA
jgi:hypothetical protein